MRGATASCSWPRPATAARPTRTIRPANADDIGPSAGNGRVNLARAIGDSSTNEVEPAGAAPNGTGGPFVGPYVIAAPNVAITFPTNNSIFTTSTFNAGNSTPAGDIAG